MIIVGTDPGVKTTGIAIYRPDFAVPGRATRQFELRSVSGREPEALVRAVVAALSDPLAILAIEDQRYVGHGKAERGETNFAAQQVRDIQMLLTGAAHARGHAVMYVNLVKAKAALVSARATKEQMKKAVMARFHLEASEHEADAVGVCLAAHSMLRMEQALGAVRKQLKRRAA